MSDVILAGKSGGKEEDSLSIGRYRQVAAVGQQDNTACWAACLEWWARAVGREETEQWILMEDYDFLWDNGGDGTISRAGLLTIVRDSRWRMEHQVLPTVQDLNPVVLFAFLRTGPVFTGFFDQQVSGNHVNVIYGMGNGETNPRVFAMEPGHTRRSDGSYRGRHVHRDLSYYKRQGDIILASPRSGT